MQFPPVTRALLIVNVLVYLLQQPQGLGDTLLTQFALWPLGPHELMRTYNGTVSVGFQPWQVITYAFLHGSFPHVAFNMFALWMFGGPVENALGPRRYTLLYFVCVLGAAAAQLATVALFAPGDFYPTLGASGGVFGLLIAFAMLYPQARIAALYFPIPIPAPIAVVLYMLLELIFGVTGTQSSVAHFAHLGGAVVGFAMVQYWKMTRGR